MLWLKHERTGYTAPINADIFQPGPAGNPPAGNIAVDLLSGKYHVVTHREREAMLPTDLAGLRLNHFVTCPDRREYRRRMSRR